MKNSLYPKSRLLAAAVLTALAGGLGMVNLIAEEKGKAEDETPEPTAEDLAWMSELTTIPPGKHAELNPVAVHFNLSWNNVLNAGELALSMDRQADKAGGGDETLVGAAKGRSGGLARLLWPYDVEVKAIAEPETLRPHLFELNETERDKSVRYLLDFQPGKLISETTVLPKKEGDEAETKRKIYRFDHIHDVLSVALYIRSQELAKGDSVSALVSPFNRPYHAEFTLVGKEKRKIRRENYDTLKFDVAIRKVNHDKTLQTYDKMKKATIWISDDEYRLPIEIHADIFIGFVSARMTERTWITGSSNTDGSTAGKKKKSGLSQFLEDHGNRGSSKVPSAKRRLSVSLQLGRKEVDRSLNRERRWDHFTSFDPMQ